MNNENGNVIIINKIESIVANISMHPDKLPSAIKRNKNMGNLLIDSSLDTDDYRKCKFCLI